MRPLPDLDFSLRDVCDFVMDSRLGRKALMAPDPINLAVLVRDLLRTIFRLTASCHLSEFTDHGLGHLCSLVDRLSRWSGPGPEIDGSSVVGRPDFTSQEASILLLATLLHDIGMLSQRVEDMPVTPGVQASRPLADLNGWVRDTHIDRLERLTRFLFEQSDHATTMDHAIVQRAFKVARAHGKWPWKWPELQFEHRDSGLAAMLAVADLLDEDSLRCDTETLLRHRRGTSLNRAHWIRHGLTSTRVLVDQGRINIVLSVPPNTTARFETVFAALKNHYRLVRLYNTELTSVHAQITELNFAPSDGLTERHATDLAGWQSLPGFTTEGAMIYHLLSSFMAEALVDPVRLPQETIAQLQLQHLGMDLIDLTNFYEVRNIMIPRTAAEENFHALLTF